MSLASRYDFGAVSEPGLITVFFVLFLFSPLKKMAGGMVLAAVAFAVCGFVQIKIQVCVLVIILLKYII